jgi:hypothetical protein
MKNKLFTLAAALTLAAVIGSIYAAPALAQVIKAALVKNIDEKGRAPFERVVHCIGGTPTCTINPIFTVPNDRRLVLEHISSRISVNTGGIQVMRIIDSTFRNRAFPVAQLQTTHPQIQYAVNAAVLNYFEAGDTVGVNIESDTPLTGNVQADVTISGYLVDLTN